MSEYLVEVSPGFEVVYRSPLALRAAMRTGEITSESRVYHRTAARWIPITAHPEYRKFLAERRPAGWLEPIPFEATTAPPAEELPGKLSALKAMLERAGVKVRARFSRRAASTEATQQSSPAKDAKPDGSNGEGSPLDHRHWTYLP